MSLEFEVDGLPVHVLIVHAVVVFVPHAAPRHPGGRRLAGGPTAHRTAGQWLKARLPTAPLIEQHAALGDDLLPWSIAVVVR